VVVSLESRPIYFIQVKYIYMPHAIIIFSIFEVICDSESYNINGNHWTEIKLCEDTKEKSCLDINLQ